MCRTQSEVDMEWKREVTLLAERLWEELSAANQILCFLVHECVFLVCFPHIECAHRYCVCFGGTSLVSDAVAKPFIRVDASMGSSRFHRKGGRTWTGRGHDGKVWVDPQCYQIIDRSPA